MKRNLCDNCEKNLVWKTRTINGERKRLCQTCNLRVDRTLKKEKTDKQRERKKQLRAKKEVSMENLQLLFQKFTRLVTEDICSSCGSNYLGNRIKNGGHMIPKKNFKSVALLCPNIYSQCNVCNSPINGGMPLFLRKYGVNYWGEKIIEQIEDMSRISYTFNLAERTELFEKVNDSINRALNIKESFADNSQSLLKDLHFEMWEWQKNQTWFKSIDEDAKKLKKLRT
jgi:hypothetical protein